MPPQLLQNVLFLAAAARFAERDVSARASRAGLVEVLPLSY